MTIKRTSHTVYDPKYHLGWAPTSRRWISREELRQRAAELLRDIAHNFQFEIEEMEVAKDHGHVCLNFPPRDSMAKVVGILKSISASELFQEFPELRRQLWGGEFWEDGDFVRTVGDQVTADVIKRSIQYHRHEEREGNQLDLF